MRVIGGDTEDVRVVLQHRIPVRQAVALADFTLADVVEQLDGVERETLAVIKTVAGPAGVCQDDETALPDGALNGLLQRQALIDTFELTQADDMKFNAARIRAVQLDPVEPQQAGRRPWLFAIAAGLWIPLRGVFVTQNSGSLLALIFSFGGAYAGFAIRLIVQKILKPAGRDPSQETR